LIEIHNAHYNKAVDEATARSLIRLNQQFYQTFAEQFSATRQQIQPGVRKVIRQIPQDCRILDLGCGNGKLWQRLVEGGFQGQYTGLDFSAKLLDVAKEQAHQTVVKQPAISPALFIHVDLTDKGWETGLQSQAYDFVLAFAVLHHLPRERNIMRTLKQIHRLLAPGGNFIFSVWQFLNSPRLRERIQDWSRIGLSPNQVEQNDYLLDWRQGGHGLRYVHHFAVEELGRLSSRSGFCCTEVFLSDGKGGNLSLYQTWILENVIV
jgi:2-polyprenyl-3-methyl-5-hydroxy-6-metoxy-1,4-benzoquinol methylase